MVCVMDISDAFLQVCQREFVLIQVLRVREALKGQQDVIPEYWQLGRCLPGQRNAAQRWAEHFGAIFAEHVFENFQGGTIYRHRSGQAYLSIHVDDTILVASEEFCISFHREISKKMKAKLDGPLGCGRDGALYYLKRQLEFSESGIDLSCNAKYIPKLVEMLHVTERRGKSVPGHHGLQVYDSETISESEFLNTKDARIFRSGLGVCIYMSQERVDIQHSVRVLASYMAKPTRSAMSGLSRNLPPISTTPKR